MNYTDALSGSLGSLIGLAAGFVLAILISRQLRLWLDALRSVNAITALKQRNSSLHVDLDAANRTVKELTDQNELLRREIAALQESLLHREKTIDDLLRQVKARDQQIKVFTEELGRVHAYQEEFETKLFKFLTVNLGVDPDDIKWQIGLNEKKKP